MSLTETLSYTIDELRKNWNDPMWWRHRIGNRINGSFQTNVYPGREGSTYVSEADWDVLIVLDGCRADLFEEIVGTERFDSYRRVKSPGSKTPEWAQQNFGDGEFGDIVYIASNGQVSNAITPAFHRMIEIWQSTDGVPYPEDISEAARAAGQDYPDKRIIAHYLQPHRPFIVSEDRFSEGFTDNPWQALAVGNVDRETVWELYRKNLKVVVEDVFDLAETLPGRVVVTSDHGNLLGERTFPIPIRMYGHPGGIRHPGLVEVPWGVIESDNRPEIREGDIRDVKQNGEAVRDHLADLGYL